MIASTESRRRFLRRLFGGSVAGLAVTMLYPLARFLDPPRVSSELANEVEAGRTDDPELLEHGSKIVRFGSEPVILIRVAADDYRAFTATCTHLDCIVDYRRDKRLIWCWCHNGIYDLHGQNIGGPPPRPLRQLSVHRVPVDGTAETLVISRRRGSEV